MARTLDPNLTDTLRRKVLPWLIWGGLAVGSFIAWRAMGLGLTVRGFAESLPYRLAAVEPARVESVLVAVGDRVSAGQVLAVLDARSLDGELRALEGSKAATLAEMARAELEARRTWRGERRTDSNAELQNTRLAREAKTRLETATAELAAVRAELGKRKQAVASGAMRASDLTELEIRQASLTRAVSAERAALELYTGVPQSQGEATEPATLEAWIEAARTPYLRMLDVYDGQSRALEARRDQRVLRAPVDGQVVAVHGRADSVAVPGQPLLEVVTDTPGRLIACVNEELNAHIAVGTRASARPRSSRDVRLSGTTVSVTPVVELPQRCWRLPQVPVWGRLVTIELTPRVTLVPGETFDIAFDPGDGS